jgi:hypothetical protein
MTPLWIYILVGLAIVVVYYIIKYVSPETAGILLSYLKKYGFIIALIIAYFIFRDTLGYFTEADWLGRKANTYLIFCILFFLIYQNFMGNARYHTHQIVCRNGFHGSVAEPPILTKDGFAIFNVGSILWGVHYPFGEKTLILRRETYNINGIGNYVSIARPSRTSLNKLPPDEKETILNISSMNKQNIFYGWFDDLEKIDFPKELIEKLKQMKNKGEFFEKIFDIENPRVDILLRSFMNICAGYNTLQEQHDKATSSIEGFDEHIYRRRKVWDRAKAKEETQVEE